MLKIGENAPLFSLPCNGNVFDISTQISRHQNTVLFFYPKDNTPGCKIEAIEFSSLNSEFEKNNSIVFGISKDSQESHDKFTQKCNLSINLMSDIDGKVCEAYFVIRKIIGIIKRSTFIIGQDGIIKYANYDVNPRGHAQEILNIIKP
jgi:peroxiredoxin